MKEKMTIGEVISVHGIRGELKVKPLTDDPGRFYDPDAVYITQKGKSTLYDIEMIRLHKGNVLLSLEKVRDRESAEKMKGAFVEIDRTEAVDLDEDEYFITDLIGLTVRDKSGAVIGKIKDVLQTTGTVDTLEIKTAVKLLYVPFRKLYFPEIDFNAGIITSDIPEDLLTL